MEWAIHLHLIAAISWIGGSIFLFVLGVTMHNKEDQKEVYSRIGPIYGYFEVVALILLIMTGIYMISHLGLTDILFDDAVTNKAINALRMKLLLVVVLIVLTLIHTIIAVKTIHIQKSLLQTLFSRASSLGIFFFNLIVLHYAIILRDIL